MLKSLNQHRHSAATDQHRLSTVTEHVNRPLTTNNLKVDDSLTSIATVNDAIPCELGIKRGDVFANTATLGDKISQYAMEHNFHVRREKHAIVCSNSGHTTWTAVNDVQGRAKQKLRKLKKKHVDDGDLDVADTGQDWRDLVQCEEEQVSDILTAMYFVIIVTFVYLFFSFQAKFKKVRAKSSTKCGCNWKVRFTKKKGESQITLTSMDLSHTHGCVPSPELNRRQVVNYLCLLFSV
jgi:hypothetical protein